MIPDHGVEQDDHLVHAGNNSHLLCSLDLVKRFAPELTELLEARKIRQAEFDRGASNRKYRARVTPAKRGRGKKTKDTLIASIFLRPFA